MKKKLYQLLLPLLLLASWGARAQTPLQSQSFENGETVNYTASTVASGNSNIYFTRASLPVTSYTYPSGLANIRDVNGNNGGTYFWASENVRRDPNAASPVRANPPANLALSPINVTGKSNFSVKVALADAAANNTSGTGWETNDFVRIQYRFDGGTWANATGGQFVGTRNEDTGVPSFGPLTQDADGNGVADTNGAILNQTLTDYTFAIPGSGSTLEVRVQIDQDGASEEFGFDAIRVYGSAAASAAPVLSNLESTALNYAEGQGAVPITNTLTISDDGTTLNGARVAISANFQSSEDQLVFINQNGITGSYNTGTGVLTMSGTAAVATYQAALRSIQYQNTDTKDASPLTRTVSFSVTDATNVGSNMVARNIAVTTALDAPGGLPYAEDLENGDGEGTRYATNKATATLVNGRYFNRTNVTSEPAGQWHTTGSAATTISGINNSYYWWVSGSSVLSGGVGTFITKQTNTAGYYNLNFSVKLAASNNVWENGQYLRVSYRLGGSNGTWQPLLSFRSTDQTTTTSQSSTTGNLRQDANPATTTGVPTGAQLTPALTTYSAPLPASANGQLVDFRIEALSIASDGVGEVIAFDNLQLTGSPVVAPTVTTGTAGTTTTTTAAVNNNTLSSDGGANLTDYGVVYVAGTGTPTTSNAKVQAGTSSPSSFPTNFSVSLSSLTAGTQYTARAYATNSAGTSYGATVTFTTTPNAPVVTIPANGGIINTTTPPYSGTAQANATITVIVDGASIGTTTANASGSWNLVQPTALAQGSHTVYATAQASGSAVSANSNTNTFTVDSVRPSVAISSSAGASGGSTSTSPIPYTATFSENVTGFVAGDVSVTGGTVSGFTAVSGTTYTFNVTPAAAGTVAVNIAANVAQDQAGNGNTTASQYSLTFQAPTIAVAPASLPNGQQGTAYSQALSASGGTAPYTFAITAGALPSGLSLSSGGTIAGTPTTNGTFTFTVTATDASAAPGPYSGSRSYTLTINAQPVTAAPVVTTPANGSFSNNRSVTATGTAPAGSTVSVFIGNNLAGTTTATATGTFSYLIPGNAPDGTYTVSATAQSSGATTSAQSNINTFTIDGTAPTVALSSNLASGSSTSTSPVSFTATFNEPVTNFTSSGIAVTNGTVTSGPTAGSGNTYSFQVTPRGAGNVTVTVLANAAQDRAGNNNTASSQYAFTFQASTITVGPAALPDGQQGTAYSQALSASGGTAPYTFAITAGALPSGLTLTSAGTLSGTPTANGNFTFTVTATDASAAPGPYSGSRSYTLTINAQPVTAAPVVTTPGNNSFSNNRSVTATGTAPAGSTVSIFIGNNLAGTTPASATGAFSYLIPGNAPDGTYTVSATAQSSGATTSAQSNINTFTIDGTAPTAALSSNLASGSSTSTSPVSFTATFNEPVTNFTSSGITVTNGTVTSGPTAGSGNTYSFQVTPRGAGNVTVTVLANAAQDRAGNNNTASSPYAFTFQAPTITVAPASLPNGQQGTAYSQALSASGGTAPYAYAITAGALPAGLSLTNGTIAGTPTTNGTFNFTVTVTDASAAPGPYTGSRSYTLVISTQPVTAAPVVTAPANGSSTNSTTPTYQGTASTGSTVTVYIDGASIGTTTATGGSWSLVQPTALAQGSHTVYATAQSSGSAVSANSNTNTFTVDSVRPSVAISSSTATSGSSSTTSPFAFTVTFSESVAGFVAGDLSVSNGTVSGFSGSGSTYTFTVTPTTATIATTVNVAANVAQDQAGNGNTAAASAYSITLQAPTIVVAPATLPNGTQGTAYSQVLSASGGTAPYTFAITAGALPAGLTLTSAGTLAGTPTTNGTFNFTVTATDASAAPGPYSGSRAYTLTIAAPAVTSVSWNGNTNTDWFNASNWTPSQVPDATINAIIPTSPSGGRFPVITSNTVIAQVRNLTINSGATLTQTNNSLVLAANLTNNGTFQATGGTVLLGNTSQSNILGASNTRFWNLTVGSNGAQQSTSASTSVQRLLLLNGNFAINGNPFTLESNANSTAMVVNNNGVVTGNVTVQRYIDPSLNPNLGYRHFSSPVSTATVGSLTTGSFSPVVNPNYNTSAQPGTVTPFPTVYGYDQSRLATATNNLPAFDKGWFSPSALSSALNVGQGYTVNLTANQAFSLTGPQNNGNVALNLARNPGPTAADAGLALVGNPYPSPLDWSQVAQTDRPGLDGVIFVFQSNDPTNPYVGSYGFYNNGIGNISPVLPLGQGFFVRVSNDQTAATLTFKNSHRPTTYSNNAYYRTAAETRPLVQLTLKGTGSAVSDDAFVYFEQGSTEGFDAQYDAVKLPNPNGLNLSASVAGQQFSIDGLPGLGSVQRVIPLAVGVPAAGAYSLTSTQLLNLSTTPTYLRDLQTGALVDLAQQPSYQFTVSNAAALITGRFELVFSPQKALATVPAALTQQVGLYPNPAKTAAFVELPASLGRQAVTATLVDALGRVARTVVLPAQGALAHQLDLHELPTGIYALRLSTSAGVVVKRLTVE